MVVAVMLYRHLDKYYLFWVVSDGRGDCNLRAAWGGFVGGVGQFVWGGGGEVDTAVWLGKSKDDQVQ